MQRSLEPNQLVTMYGSTRNFDLVWIVCLFRVKQKPFRFKQVHELQLFS